MTTVSPYGTWNSSISPEKITAESIRLGTIQFFNGELYWTEGRPAEGGRNALCSQNTTGTITDTLPVPWNVRTRVNEYGGRAFVVSEDGLLFSNFKDQRLYLSQNGEEPKALTPENAKRYAAPIPNPTHGGWIAVEEDHGTKESEPPMRLVHISPEGKVVPLVEGSDFYASPTLNTEGNGLAWLEWDHPDMPWDAARLMLGTLDENGDLVSATCIAGGEGESAFQPQWSPDGVLYFMAENTGWWNLYRLGENGVEAVWSEDVEMGLPLWIFGMSTYGFANEETAAVAYCEHGVWGLATVDLVSLEVTRHDLPFSSIRQVRAENNRIAVFAGAADQAECLVLLDGDQGTWEVLRSSSALSISEGELSSAKPVSFPTSEGAQAHGFYYAPRNDAFAGEANEKPPLIVISHGGPTAATNATLDARIQYWTSRGFAVLDVNYRGSTGYGRAYRNSLLGNWGVYDVDDCVAGAHHLVAQGLADENRLAIRGGSAGGYTTLAALAFRDVFKAGASYFGVGDIEALDSDTHKFESRYTQRLVAPLPEGLELVRERSPIHHTDKLSCPVIFLQGLEDKIVPPNQSEAMVDALKEKGIPVAYFAFEGEGHGFRQAEAIQRALQGEFAFYAYVFQFDPADTLPDLDIHNR